MVIGVIVGLFGIVLALSTGLVWGTIRHQALVKEHGILEATNHQLTTQLATQKSDLMQLANRLFDEKTNRFSQDNQQSLNTLLAPFKTALSEFKTTLDQTQRHEADQRAALKGELSQLVTLNQTMAQEARQLSNALKGNTKTQGNWGELILETVLEQSGLEKGREFIVQTGLKTDTGERQQPDVILKLPGDRHIIIDSKVSLNAYELYTQTPDAHPLKLHIQAIRNHIKTLSEKNYPALTGLNSPDFVLMFLPIEPALTLALQHDSQLFYDAMKHHVVLVSPSTLFATLHIIQNLWKQAHQNQFAHEIAKQSGALYDKFFAVAQELDKLGQQLTTTQNTHAAIMNKLIHGKGNVVTRIENIKKLGAKASKDIQDLSLLDRYI